MNYSGRRNRNKAHLWLCIAALITAISPLTGAAPPSFSVEGWPKWVGSPLTDVAPPDQALPQRVVGSSLPFLTDAVPLFRKKEAPMSREQLESSGKLFKSELERAFRYFDRSRSHHFDVTSIARRYFKIGMSFDDAEIIMKSAGMRIFPRPVQPTPSISAQSFHNVENIAEIERYGLSGILDYEEENRKIKAESSFSSQIIGTAGVSLYLSPARPNSMENAIKDVWATAFFPRGPSEF